MNNPGRLVCVLGIAAVAVLAAAGCATVYGPPPTDQLAVANAAVADATGADAAQLAAPELTAAQRNLARARQALRVGDNAVAREFAEEAEADARLAATHARAVKAARAAAQVEASNQALRDEIARHP